MSRRSRRTWFAVAVIGLICLATVAHFMGGAVMATLRELHGPR